MAGSISTSSASCTTLQIDPSTGNHVSQFILAYDASQVKYARVKTYRAEELTGGQYLNVYTARTINFASTDQLVGMYGYEDPNLSAIYDIGFFTVNKGCRVDTESTVDVDEDPTDEEGNSIYYVPTPLKAFSDGEWVAIIVGLLACITINCFCGCLCLCSCSPARWQKSEGLS